MVYNPIAILLLFVHKLLNDYLFHVGLLSVQLLSVWVFSPPEIYNVILSHEKLFILGGRPPWLGQTWKHGVVLPVTGHLISC